jgi:membrane protein
MTSLLRLRQKIAADNVSIIAAAIAFYALLAAFPALSVLVSIYGIIVEPSQVARHLSGMEGLLPDPAIKLLSEHMHRLVLYQKRHLGLSLVIGLAFTFMSAHAGTQALVSALNNIYGEEDRRSPVRRQIVGLAITSATLVFTGALLALIALVPLLIGHLPLSRTWRHLVALVRWPVLALMMMTALASLYRFAPSRPDARWRLLSKATCGATALWLAVSAGFSIYVSQLGSYDRIYGSLGAAIVLLIWFYLSAAVVLLGAEIEAHARITRRVPGPI